MRGRLIAGTPRSPGDLALPLSPPPGAASSPPWAAAGRFYTRLLDEGSHAGPRPSLLPGPPLGPPSLLGSIQQTCVASRPGQPRGRRSPRRPAAPRAVHVPGYSPSLGSWGPPRPPLPPLSSQTAPAPRGLADGRLCLFSHPWIDRSGPMLQCGSSLLESPAVLCQELTLECLNHGGRLAGPWGKGQAVRAVFIGRMEAAALTNWKLAMF